MKAFSYTAPGAVTFGCGSLTSLEGIVQSYAESLGRETSVFLLTDRGVASTGVARTAAALVASVASVRVCDAVPAEPTDDDVDQIAAECMSRRPDVIVGIGGGSVLDAAKLLGVLTGGSIRARSLIGGIVPEKRALTVLVPTTAGTGSEATPNAIVALPREGIKQAIVSPRLMPSSVILDPSLTASLPRGLTASTGIDALCHLVECFISRKANAFSDALALEGVRLVFHSLERACIAAGDVEARSEMLLASHYGGICICASGTNAVHALSYPIGGALRVPHGVANAILLAPTLELLVEDAAERIARLAEAVGIASAGSEGARAFVARLSALCGSVGIPSRLSQLGIASIDVDALAIQAHGVRRLLDNSPRDLSVDEIKAVYRRIA